MIIEKITKIVSEPYKVKTSYGTWAVKADCAFYSEENGNSWNYPAKSFYFWNKTRALKFINNMRLEDKGI